MHLNPNYNISHQTWLEAKAFVERKWVEFFDFYRNSAFGFVRIAQERKGYYSSVIVGEENFLIGNCTCRKASRTKVCPHAYALFLRLINWPREQANLSDQFDSWPVTHFFKSMGHHYHGPVNKTTNPQLTITTDDFDPRLLDYWGFARVNEMVSKRDAQALGVARSSVRTPMEVAMLVRKMPSTQLQFEESIFYRLSKLFFFLDLHSSLEVKILSQPEHQVKLEIRQEGRQIFSWVMPVEPWLKAIRQHWDFWIDRADFEVCKQSRSLHYRVGFTAENNLEIQALVPIAEGQHAQIADLLIPGSRNLYYHPSLGYFNIGTGLSPFEMEFSHGNLVTLDRQLVNRFLKQHQSTLETMDRDLMDESIFGEVTISHFDQFRMQLMDCQGHQFQYDLEARLEEHWFSKADLQRIFNERGRYRKLGGKLFDSEGFDGTYLRNLFQVGELLDVHNLMRLFTMFKDRMEVSVTDLTREIYGQLSEFKVPDAPSLKHTRLNLRSYQELGYQWLHFLSTFGLGGLLCDQMGLGKTHQGMALAASIFSTHADARILVVAPTSVLFHWKDKLTDFCPKTVIRVHHGPDRDAGAVLASGRIIITSYGTIRNDAEIFYEKAFDLVIYDEIQYVKNKKTKAWKALSNLRSVCRVGLTGTPIENSLFDLKSMFDLVMPGYLGEDRVFEKFFVMPITKGKGQASRERLRGVINPFMLRRSKSQVLTELPEKTEDLRRLKLDAYSLDLYNEQQEQSKKQMAEMGKATNRFAQVFQLIDKLKRICNHPALFFENDDYAAYPSAKWEMFTELLQEALDSGEKIVVMTQFPGMIDIITRYLRHLGIEYAYIHGKVQDREAQQKRFMEDPACRVFIGTPKTAGVGIDLTAASIMIHYDRWWNPAVEEQATDRIHRFGQKKNVQVYKFLTRNTVEERINTIIQRKQGLLEGVIEFDSDTIAKSFTLEELLEIIR